jgi:uncharacterized membrane protein
MEGRETLAELIAIGYPDEDTAALAEREVERLADELVIDPEAFAVIRRDTKGHYHVTTSRGEVAVGTVYGLLWGLLFGALFFIPVVGLVVGAATGALVGLVARLGISEEFLSHVRDTLRPGTSALFIVAEKITLDKTIDALSKFGGTVLRTSLSKDAEAELEAALEGVPAGSAS